MADTPGGVPVEIFPAGDGAVTRSTEAIQFRGREVAGLADKSLGAACIAALTICGYLLTLLLVPLVLLNRQKAPPSAVVCT